MIEFNFVVTTQNFEFTICLSPSHFGTSIYDKNNCYFLNDIEFDYQGHIDWIKDVYFPNHYAEWVRNLKELGEIPF